MAIGITRRAAVGGLAATAVTAPAILKAQAQAFPAPGSTIKFVVGFPAGGAQDIVGRIVADRMAALWNVTTLVENVAGAGGNIGMDRVAKGPSDGTQIMIIPPGFTTNQFLYAKMPFDPEKDIVPLVNIADIPNLLCVKKGFPVKTTKELIDYAKANPGKLNYASSGIGTSIHLSAELFKSMTGTNIVPVHYRGSAPAMNDILAGNVDLIFDNIPSIIGHARAGSVTPLGVTTPKRSSHAPEYPTIADTVSGFDVTSYAGLGVRAGTPKEICDKIEQSGKAICKDPVLIERLKGLVAESSGAGAAEFGAYLAGERKKWGKLIGELKIKAD
jgi:tripartite-type tricarboxylate transporter receptor subunit TctC